MYGPTHRCRPTAAPIASRSHCHALRSHRHALRSHSHGRGYHHRIWRTVTSIFMAYFTKLRLDDCVVCARGRWGQGKSRVSRRRLARLLGTAITATEQRVSQRAACSLDFCASPPPPRSRPLALQRWDCVLLQSTRLLLRHSCEGEHAHLELVIKGLIALLALALATVPWPVARPELDKVVVGAGA
jgi:hypothetical protein